MAKKKSANAGNAGPQAGIADVLRAVLHASPAAIIRLDLEGRVQTWNEAAERIFGWAAGEVIGQPLP